MSWETVNLAIRFWSPEDTWGLDPNTSPFSLNASTPAHGNVRGNTVTAEATFTRADGSTSAIADVILQNNPTDSRYLGDTTVSSAAAATAANLKGFGDVTDLAMSHDATLLAEVTSFKALAANTSWTTLRAVR